MHYSDIASDIRSGNLSFLEYYTLTFFLALYLASILIYLLDRGANSVCDNVQQFESGLAFVHIGPQA